MADAEVTGLNDLVHVTKALKAAGEEGKGLRKELYAGLNRATKPIRADLNAEVPPTFPHGGGLAGLMAKRAKFGQSVQANANGTGIRLVARGKGRRTLAQANQRGTISHPVFGNRRVWREQSQGIQGDLVDKEFKKDVPVVKREVLRAIADVKSKIDRSI